MIGRNRAEKVLDRALSALESAGAEAAQATLMVQDEGLTRFANNYIHQNVHESDAALSLFAGVGLRLGSSSTNRLDRSGILAAARRAVAIARQAAEDPEFPGLVSSPPAPEVASGFDARTARMSPTARARIVARATKRSARKGTSASGKVSSSGTEIAVANSAGTVQYAALSGFGASCTAMVEGAAGSENWSGGSTAALKRELGRFGADAVKTALKARNPKKVPPGEWTVILSPRAVSEMLGFLSYLGFNAQAHIEGRSCLTGKMGTRVVDEKVTLRDDGLCPEGLPLPFDFEGVPRQTLTLIERGVARDLPHSGRTAKKMDARPTGHSFGPTSTVGGLPMHLVMDPGETPLEEMIASTDKGLFVSRFWYTNIAEPSKAVITGMTRDGLFQVNKGKLRRAACNLRFTQSVLEALSNVEAVGSELVGVGGDWGAGQTRCPALKIRDFRFTGATEF
ncbi:MAG: TldD/PmbA family protein [Planctomycetota bacterium]|jgi:predicted Zn-dependent protease